MSEQSALLGALTFRVPWLGPAAALLLAMVVSVLPGMAYIEHVTARHERVLLTGTLSVAACGFLIMMGGILLFVLHRGTKVTGNDTNGGYRAQWFAIPPSIRGVLVVHKPRSLFSRQVEVEASFAEVKAAIRSGSWWRDPDWRRFFVTVAGGLLLTGGLFGMVVVMGPMPIKLLFAGVLVYGTVRTAQGFARA